jgi:large subunit ribosomal protein L4
MADINIKVLSQTGAEVSTIKLSKDVFGVEVNEQTMFDAVMTYSANVRQATAKTKRRHEVSGGGKKPYRQKGTGRARAGSTRSPIWVGGGCVNGPDGKQSFTLKQNKKEHDLALKSALTTKVKDFVVLDKLTVGGKTKEVIDVEKALKINDTKVLLVSEDSAILQGCANLSNIIVRGVKNISVYDLLNAGKIVILTDDIKKIEEDLK